MFDNHSIFPAQGVDPRAVPQGAGQRLFVLEDETDANVAAILRIADNSHECVPTPQELQPRRKVLPVIGAALVASTLSALVVSACLIYPHARHEFQTGLGAGASEKQSSAAVVLPGAEPTPINGQLSASLTNPPHASGASSGDSKQHHAGARRGAHSRGDQTASNESRERTIIIQDAEAPATATIDHPPFDAAGTSLLHAAAKTDAGVAVVPNIAAVRFATQERLEALDAIRQLRQR